MKKIYFVRHGATAGNENNEFQLGTVPLSDMGLKQAQFVAERFKSISIDVIIASNMERAAKTADTVAKILDKEVIYTTLFQEILRPSFVRGKKKDVPEVIKIMEDVKVNFENPDWHHSDEENFFDVKNRAIKSLEFIQSRSEQNILIVTHGNFLMMLIAIMGFGDTFTAKQYKKMQKFFIAKNTGITVVDEHKGEYFLLTWNDYAHLGDVDIPHVYS